MNENPEIVKPSIPDLLLPSGGVVMFVDLDTVTGKDLHRLRAALDVEGAGSSANAFMQRALEMLVADWTVPYADDLRIPRLVPRETMRLRATDLSALERHLQPTLRLLTRGPETEDEDAPGSPRQPASA